MNSAVIILIAAAIYVGMYVTYGRGLQNKVVKAAPTDQPRHTGFTTALTTSRHTQWFSTATTSRA